MSSYTSCVWCERQIQITGGGGVFNNDILLYTKGWRHKSFGWICGSCHAVSDLLDELARAKETPEEWAARIGIPLDDAKEKWRERREAE